MSKHATRHSPIDTATWAAWERQKNWYAGMNAKDIFKHAFRTGWQAAKRKARRASTSTAIQKEKS